MQLMFETLRRDVRHDSHRGADRLGHHLQASKQYLYSSDAPEDVPEEVVD